MKIQRKRYKTWIPEVKRLLKSQPEGNINVLMGSKASDILLLAPVPTEDDVRNNCPWANRQAARFLTMMETIAGVSIDRFLILPVNFTGEKPRKANTDLPLRLFDMMAPSFDKFVCVGSAAFKLFFGYGRLPSMNALAGSITYLERTNFKPLFVFPEFPELNPQLPTGRISSAEYRLKIKAEEAEITLERFLQKFKSEFMTL